MSKDLDDQLRGKSIRLSRLKAEVGSFTSKMREARLEEEAAGKRADEFRSQTHAHNVEIEQLRAESRLLRLASQGNTEGAADVGQAVETMRATFLRHISNPKVPAEVASKKQEAEQAKLDAIEAKIEKARIR